MDLFSYLRNCAYCKHGIIDPIDLFCEPCWQKILSLKRPYKYPVCIQKLEVYPLFIWSGQNDILETLLYSLKGGGMYKAFERLAREFLLHYQPPIKNQKYCVLPVPPSLPQKQDHAYELAKGMANSIGGALCAELKWCKKHKPQKLLSKYERASLEMQFASSLHFASKTKIIIVDDVVTTGATIQAASRAIQGPNAREIWCISYRI